MKLFICGNGFDLHLGFKTEYTDYHNALLHDNLIAPADKQKAQDVLENGKYFSNKGTDTWSNLEKSLSFDFNSYVNDLITVNTMPANIHDDKCIARHNAKVKDFQKSDPGRIARDFTNQWFWSWIAKEYYDNCDRVKSEKIHDPLHSIMSRTDLYITFNYTHSLEDIFDIPKDRILYIHNRLKDKARKASWSQPWTQDELLDDLINSGTKQFQFGSVDNSKINIEELEKKIDTQSSDKPSSKESLKIDVQEIYYAFTKNPHQNYEILKEFLDRNYIDEVVILGHSIMGIDTPYYEDVLVPLFKNCEWRLYYYDKDDSEQNAFIKKYALPHAHLVKW